MLTNQHLFECSIPSSTKRKVSALYSNSEPGWCLIQTLSLNSEPRGHLIQTLYLNSDSGGSLIQI